MQFVKIARLIGAGPTTWGLATGASAGALATVAGAVTTYYAVASVDLLQPFQGFLQAGFAALVLVGIAASTVVSWLIERAFRLFTTGQKAKVVASTFSDVKSFLIFFVLGLAVGQTAVRGSLFTLPLAWAHATRSFEAASLSNVCGAFSAAWRGVALAFPTYWAVTAFASEHRKGAVAVSRRPSAQELSLSPTLKSYYTLGEVLSSTSLLASPILLSSFAHSLLITAGIIQAGDLMPNTAAGEHATGPHLGCIACWLSAVAKLAAPLIPLLTLRTVTERFAYGGPPYQVWLEAQKEKREAEALGSSSGPFSPCSPSSVVKSPSVPSQAPFPLSPLAHRGGLAEVIRRSTSPKVASGRHSIERGYKHGQEGGSDTEGEGDAQAAPSSTEASTASASTASAKRGSGRVRAASKGVAPAAVLPVRRNPSRSRSRM